MMESLSTRIYACLAATSSSTQTRTKQVNAEGHLDTPNRIASKLLELCFTKLPLILAHRATRRFLRLTRYGLRLPLPSPFRLSLRRHLVRLAHYLISSGSFSKPTGLPKWERHGQLNPAAAFTEKLAAQSFRVRVGKFRALLLRTASPAPTQDRRRQHARSDNRVAAPTEEHASEFAIT